MKCFTGRSRLSTVWPLPACKRLAYSSTNAFCYSQIILLENSKQIVHFSSLCFCSFCVLFLACLSFPTQLPAPSSFQAHLRSHFSSRSFLILCQNELWPLFVSVAVQRSSRSLREEDSVCMVLRTVGVFSARGCILFIFLCLT